jgi:hypothetical protein
LQNLKAQGDENNNNINLCRMKKLKMSMTSTIAIMKLILLNDDDYTDAEALDNLSVRNLQ